MIEQSTFFIKPEAAELTTSLIIPSISRFGLTIMEKRQVQLTRPILEELYRRLTLDADHRPLFEENVRQLEGKTVLAGIVDGQSAIEILVSICGHRTSPGLCNPGSLRFLIANMLRLKPINCGGKYNYWPNGIHRARNGEEVKRDLRILFGKV